jgi:hypothetical protein
MALSLLLGPAAVVPDPTSILSPHASQRPSAFG